MLFNFHDTYSSLSPLFFSHVNPTPVAKPEYICLNQDLALHLGLSTTDLRDTISLQALAGNQLLANSHPLAQAYCGHQYGHFVVLGDGRAHLLGEHITPQGDRVDVQLKGSGPTPYSRRGDGRAALSPMLREYVISEAMAALGIPSTRSLAVIRSGESVYRESVQPGGILVRIASSHIRVGTFQWAALQKDPGVVKELLDYAVARHDSNLQKLPTPEKALEFLKAVQARQADLISKWLLVGFIHGVMNTDNMSVCGETIDYGPCAFLDEYQHNTVFSSIDRNGRYAFNQQGPIAQWNLTRLAECLVPLVHEDSEQAVVLLTEILNQLPDQLHQNWLVGMKEKLNLSHLENKEAEDLIQDWLQLLEKHQADYTNSFYQLSSRQLTSSFWLNQDVQSWQQAWSQTISGNLTEQQRSQQMLQINPWVTPRNHQVEKALENAVQGNMQEFNDLVRALKSPFNELTELAHLQQPPKEDERVRATYCGT